MLHTDGWAALPLGVNFAQRDNPSISVTAVFYDTPASALDLGLDGSQPGLPLCSAPPVTTITVTANLP